MAKRYTDTDIWKRQRWFRKLNPLDKLAFFYIKDQCDHAGIWKIDCSDLMDDTGIENFNLHKFIEAVNSEFDKFSGSGIKKERIKIIKKTYLWITGFIQFQYQGKEGKVNVEITPVKTALQILTGLDILDECLLKGYASLIKGKITLNKGFVRAKDKDKDKDKDKEVIKDNNKKSITKSKVGAKNIFNNFPTKADLNGLPENYIINSIELLKINNRINIGKDEVISLWEVFKTLNITGTNHYHTEDKVYQHFLKSLQYKKINGTAINNSSVNSTGTSKARVEKLRNW